MHLHNQSNDHRERQLVAQIANRDRKALETLYFAYHRRLARFLFRIAPRFETIEEVINDTFMVVWQHADEFRGASRVSTWIIGIAYRTALKSLRRDPPQRPEAEERLAHEQLASASVDPTREFEEQEWIARGLALLPLEQRMVIELAYQGGYSIDEIAVITEAPQGTVKARMFHARRKLHESLTILSAARGNCATGRASRP